jgi:hypothetical protein
MPRGSSGKSLLGGNNNTQPVNVSGFLQSLNVQTQTLANVKNVEDVQSIIGIFNVAVANIAAAKKTLTK